MTVLVVTYHALGLPHSPVSVPPSQLAADLDALADAGYAFVTLDQCADWTEGRLELPSRAAAITFDDGYASVAHEGLRVLARRGVPATVFVIAGRIGGDNRWSGQSRHVRARPLVGRDEIRALLDAGLTVGSHSLSHPTLTTLDPAALAREVNESAERLEEVVAGPVRHFSYPYGRRSPPVVEAARNRYRTAVTADARLVDRDADLCQLPRVDAHDVKIAARLRLLGARLLPPYLVARRAARRARRAVERVADSGWEGVR